MQIMAAGKSDVGRERQLNEDAYLVDPDLGLYIVCDGMGGHAAGEVASNTTISHVQKWLRDRGDKLAKVRAGEAPIDDAAQILREAIESASTTIFEMGKTDRGKKGMGTTCCALLVIAGKGVMGHVGDSRLYLLREAQLFQLSEDHTFLQEAIRYGMMTPEQAKQSTHGNIITRAVGPLETVIVDTLVFDIIVGDTLLLCSDGLHSYLEDGREIVAKLAQDALDGTAGELIDMANARGGHDNITAVLVRGTTNAAGREVETQRQTLVNATFDALRHIDLFNELSMTELVRVSNSCKALTVAEGERIIDEGDVSETLFILVEGEVEVERRGEALARLGAGSHFGEMALLSQRPRSATVRAKQASRLLALERSQFYGLLQQDAVLATKFLWKLAQTLSLRLDDFYMFHDTAAAVQNKTTLRFGLYPSPFNHGPGE